MIKIKVRFDYDEIEKKMHEKGIENTKQLCVEAGVNYHSFIQYKNKPQKGITFANAWLIAEYLGCDLMQIVRPVWDV